MSAGKYAAIIGGIAAVAIVGVAIFYANPGGVLGNLLPNSKIPPNNLTDTNVASLNTHIPTLQLMVLESNEDRSKVVARYDANNSKLILLEDNQHIRFDSPNTRAPDSIVATARSSDNGVIHLLRKSYDVNNEFFVNLPEGNYSFDIQARWSQYGAHSYHFTVKVD